MPIATAYIFNVMLKLRNINCYLQTSETNRTVINFFTCVGHQKSWQIFCPLSITLLLKSLGGSQGKCYTMANLNLFTFESERMLFVSCQSQTFPSLILSLPHGGSCAILEHTIPSSIERLWVLLVSSFSSLIKV